MSRHVLWPHRLVFDFPYGRWCTFLFMFTFMYLLFYLTGSMNKGHDEGIPLFFVLSSPTSYPLPAIPISKLSQHSKASALTSILICQIWRN